MAVAAAAAAAPCQDAICHTVRARVSLSSLRTEEKEEEGKKEAVTKQQSVGASRHNDERFLDGATEHWARLGAASS